MTSEEQVKIRFALNEKISNGILIFLLLVRFLDQDLAVWIFGAKTPTWAIDWYNGIAYILTVTIVWLNRHRLVALNIDKPFVVALILGGVLEAFRLSSDLMLLRVFIGITAGFMYVAYQDRLLVFSFPVPYPKVTWLLILLSILLALAPVVLFPSPLKTTLSLSIFISTFLGVLQSFLVLNVFEEVIFRGALWAYLRGLGLSERSAFFMQAFLFWISHHIYLLHNQQYAFWIGVPCITILLGLLAWRSKSLTPSLIGHFLYNFINQILLTIY
jgi:membrane protease YdiL (CAAX protease family)